MIRDHADTHWLACEMQHQRIMDPRPVISTAPRANLVQRRIDLDFFFVALNRLRAVADLAAEVADPRKLLPGALARFVEQAKGWPLSAGDPDKHATVRGVRNAFEHVEPARTLELRA